MFPDLHPKFEDDDLFIRETSPPSKAPDILSFCAEITEGSPVFVDVVPTPGARAGWCFANVADAITKDGGEPVHGWTIWAVPGVWNAAEFHVVLKNSRGDLIDVTPKSDGERWILFLPDARYTPGFDFFTRPNTVRERVYGTEGRDQFVVGTAAAFSDARLAYETQKAKRKGLTVTQSIGSKMKGRDRYARLIDEFLEEVGQLEAMLVPTPEGMICKGSRRVNEFRRRAATVERMKTKIFLMADMWVREMV